MVNIVTSVLEQQKKTWDNHINTHKINTYTSLNDLSLNDSNFSATDFNANLKTINLAESNAFQLIKRITVKNYPNLQASIVAKLNSDAEAGVSVNNMYTMFIRRAADPNTPILIDIVDEFTLLVGRVWSAVGNYTSETDDFAVSKFSQTQGKNLSKDFLRLDGSNKMTNQINFDTDDTYHVLTKTRTITTETDSTKYMINMGCGGSGTIAFELFKVEADNTNTKLSRLDINATSINFNASGKNNTIYHSGNLGTEHITMSTGKYIYNSDKIIMNDGIRSGNRTVIHMMDDLDEENYGSELLIGAAGNTYLGSGESVGNVHTQHRNYLTDSATYPLKSNETYGASNEQLYLCSDNDIYFESNCQNAANRIVMVYQKSGRLILPTNTDYTSYKARNIAANTSDMTAGSSALANGNIYLVYE